MNKKARSALAVLVVIIVAVLAFLMVLNNRKSGNAEPEEDEIVWTEEDTEETEEESTAEELADEDSVTDPAEESEETESEESETEEASVPETEDAADVFQDLAAAVEEIYAHTEIVNTEALTEPIEIDLSDESLTRFNLGISGENVAEAVFSEPMISSDAYSLCLLRAEDDADVDQMKADILEGADPVKWVCVSADEVAVTSSGNVILLIMAGKDAADDVLSAFAEVAGETMGETLVRLP